MTATSYQMITVFLKESKHKCQDEFLIKPVKNIEKKSQMIK